MPFARHCFFTVIFLLFSQLAIAEGIKPCRVDGKLIFTRECMLQQQREQVSDAVHQAVERSVSESQRSQPTPPSSSEKPVPAEPPSQTTAIAPAQQQTPIPAESPRREPQPATRPSLAAKTPEKKSTEPQPALSQAVSATTNTSSAAVNRSDPIALPADNEQPGSAATTTLSRSVIVEAELAPTLESRKASIEAKNAAMAAIEASRQARLRALQTMRDQTPLPAAPKVLQNEPIHPADDPTAADHPSCEATRLIQATQRNDLARLRQCHSHQALKETADARGRPLLHIAAQAGSLEALGYLLQIGADRNQRSRIDRGGLPIHVAAANNQPTAIQLLHQSGSSMDARDYLKRTPLLVAVAHGAEDALAMLIRLRADLHAVDRSGQNAIQIAAQQQGGHSLLRHLLDAGANPDQADKEGKTALHYAALSDTANLRELITHDANLDLKDGQGQTALLTAASDSLITHRDRIRLLMDAGASLNKQDHSGLTLLELAYREKDEELVRDLMKRGVNTRKLTRIIERYKDPIAKKDNAYD